MKKDIENINTNDIMTDFFTKEETKNEQRANHEQSQDKPIKKTKKNMFQISVKIDEDIEDYIKQIVWVKRTTRTAYINELIRKDFINILGANENISEDELLKLWEEYKEKTGL